MESPSPRVFLLNNYDMKVALRRYEAATGPGQHLWGYPCDGRSSRYVWVIPPTSAFSFPILETGPLLLVRRLILRLFGDPFQQWHALRRSRRGDIVYAADQVSASLLGILKTIGLFRRSLIVIVHHMPRSRRERWSLSGVDAALVLSPYVGSRLREALPRVRIIESMPWGPDLGSPVYRSGDDETHETGLEFVALGKTNRNYANLKAAARQYGLTGLIYDPAGVTTFERGREGYVAGSHDFPHMLGKLRRASGVVIPLSDPEVMSGLTEAADAIALGKPIIVSDSPAFPYDIESAHAGVVLEDASPRSCYEAIRAAVRGDAGNAASLRESYNMAAFSRRLEEIMAQISGADSHRTSV